MIRFSIIIPVRTITDYLKETISHLAKLDYPDFEVIIITDAKESYDFNGDTRFKLVESNVPHPGIKRNIGAKCSTGEVLVFLDDDAYPAKDWLTKAAPFFSDDMCYALGGPAITPPTAQFLERLSGYILASYMASGGTTYRNIPREQKLIADYPTVNLFVRKSAFEAVGGFTEEFWPGEDTKLCLDLVKKYKTNFIYSPEPVVFHHRRNMFRPHLRQVSRYGKHRGQFARIFPETSRLPTYFVPSLFTLGLAIGPLVSLLIPNIFPVYAGCLLVYSLCLTVEGVRIGRRERNIKAGLYMIAGVFLTHVVYGTNFIIGCLQRPKYVPKSLDKSSGNYIGG